MKEKIEELKEKIGKLSIELEREIKIFNTCFNGLYEYHTLIYTLKCNVNPVTYYYTSGCNFYSHFSKLFEFASKLKKNHPELSDEEIEVSNTEFCMNDEDIRNYLESILPSTTDINIGDLASNAAKVYSILESYGFSKIFAKDSQLRQLMDELYKLEKEQENKTVVEQQTEVEHKPIEENKGQMGELGEKAKGLINKGAKRLVKIATKIAEKTENK